MVDLDVIKHVSETNCTSDDPTQGIADFQDCLHQAELFDHPFVFVGPFFTLTNKSMGKGLITKKLDRVLIHDNWLKAFPDSSVDFLPPSVSDHCPAYVQLFAPTKSPKKPFKFFNYWI